LFVSESFARLAGRFPIYVEARFSRRHLCIIVGNQVLTAQQHALQFHGLGEFNHRFFALRVFIRSVSSFHLDHASSKFGSENFYAAAAEYFPIAMEFCDSHKSILVVSSAEISAQSLLGPTTVY